MAYTVTYDGDFLFDPYGDDVITDSNISGEVNAAVYFDFTIASNHRLYNKIEEKAGIVRVYSDSKLLFMGEITDIREDFYGSKQVSCVDPRDHLNDVLLRPYSTVSGEQPNTAPSSVDGYFQWLVDRYNAGTLNQKFHFQVGVNQGAYLDKNNYIYRSSEQLPSVGSELEDKILDSLGGYLTLTYPEGIPTLNLYADVHQANTQIIDFGVNLIDFTKTTGTSDQYTAIRPEGGTPEKDSDDPNAPDPKPITVDSLGDGVTSVDSDYVKKGDVVYCQSAVNRYGYREYSWTDSDTTDPQDLLEKAIADLKKKIEPKLTIEVKAVDMALFMEGYDHLECGQVARVRSKPHDVDEYLLVSSMDIDLKDPSQTKYTLGQAFDSLTGEQSAFVKSLNSGINSSLDAAASIDKALKDQAEKVDQAVTDAGNALDTANDAKDTADNAQTAADNAQQAADSAQSAADAAQSTADSAQSAADAAQGTANAAQQAAEDAKKLISTVQDSVSQIDQDLAETETKAQSAYDKANQLAGTMETVQTDISGLEDDFNGLSVTVSGVAEDANSALEQVAQTQTDLSGFKTTVSQTYATKTNLNDAISQEVLDRNAAIQVGIDGISSTVSSNYTELTTKIDAAQSDADDALAAAQTASEDLAEFTGTVTGELNDLQSQIDGSIQTWFYNGVPTISNAPANEWTTDEVKNNHLGDLYYDLDTGYAYRFMVQNGIYSWSRLADSDVTTALQNAAKAQDTADSKRRIFVTTPTPPYDVGDLWVQGSGGDIKRCQTAKTSSQSYAAADWVLASKYTDDSALDDYKDVVATTYATKSSLTQTANEIRAEVSESYQVKGDYATSDDLDNAIAQEVLDRNSAISQSATQIQQTVSQTYTTKTEASAIEDKADAAQSTADTANSNASKAQTAASNAQNTANAANSTANSTKNDLDTYKTTVSNTYATKSSVTQTADSIKSEVAATYTTKTEFQDTVDGLATTDYVQTTYATKSSLEQTEKDITSSVEAKYLSKTDASLTYATKTQLEQTEDSITTTVSQVQTIADNAYAKASQVEQTADGIQVTLTEVEATANAANTNANTAKTDASTALSTANTLSGRASQTYSFEGSSSAAWVRLGTLKTETSDTVEIVVFAGIGYNGLASQNSKISIVIRDGDHNGDDAANRYGVTVMREGNESNEVQVRSSAHGTAEVWVHFIGAYANGSYSISKASDVTWTHSGTVQSSEPTSGTVQDQSYLTNAAAAAKTATNYLKFDSSGLCVGNMTGTLGYNTLIKSTGVDIRNGSTVLSSFEASQISLGNNSSSSQIKMCGNVGTILTKTVSSAQSITLRTSNANRYMYTSTGSSGIRVDDLSNGMLELWHPNKNDLAVMMRAAKMKIEPTTSSVHYANVDMKYIASLFGNDNDHVPAYIRCGTIVRQILDGNDSVPVWTTTEFQQTFGFLYNAGDTVVVFMNGDGAAFTYHVEGSTYVNGVIYAVMNDHVRGTLSVRLNFIVCKNGL